MTAKEALKERVEQLSEEEAAEWLARLEDEFDEEELSDEELEAIQEAEEEIARGEGIPAETLFRKLGL